MDVCRLLGREESGVATEHDAHLLRLLTPIVKLYTGKQVNSLYEYVCELSANGFDCLTVLMLLASGSGCGVRGFGKFWWTGLHRGYRLAWNTPRRTGEVTTKTATVFYAFCNSQADLSPLFFEVLSIWEGTTNVLSLDVLRCVARSSGMVLHAYFGQAKVNK